jgi:hypothetical protein
MYNLESGENKKRKEKNETTYDVDYSAFSNN